MKQYPLKDALLELTYDCNSACVICAKAVKPLGPELTTDDWRRVLDELSSLDCGRIWFTGGEPLLSPSFWPLLEHARRLPWEIVVLTNATLIGSSEVTRFARYRPEWIQTTLFSLDPLIHDGITRDPGSHARTMRAVDMCRGEGLSVRVKTPIIKQNLHCVADIEDWGARLGVPILTAMILFPRMDGDTSPLRHAITDPATIRNYLRAHGKDYNTPVETADELMSCPAAKEHLAVAPSGEVYPCTPFPVVIDHVQRRSLMEIWRTDPSPSTRSIRAASKLALVRTESCPVDFCRRCPGLSAMLRPDFREITGAACAQCAHRDGVGEELYWEVGNVSPCG